MAAQGWLGLHLPEADGGQGFTLAELAVVLEELGHALLPGPLLPTVLVSAALARHPDEAVRRELLPGLADGSVTAAVALGAEAVTEARPDGSVTIGGTVRPVLGQDDARLVLVPVRRRGGGGSLAPHRPRAGRRRGVLRAAGAARRHACRSGASSSAATG